MLLFRITTLVLRNITSSVISYISKCVDNVVVTKTVRKFPNQKAWMNVRRQRSIQHCRSKTESWLKEAKSHHQRLERDLNTNSNQDLWQEIQNVTGYKSRISSIMFEATLQDELNTFSACFDPLNKDCAVKSTEDQPLSVTTADVRKILLNVNTNNLLVQIISLPWEDLTTTWCISCLCTGPLLIGNQWKPTQLSNGLSSLKRL